MGRPTSSDLKRWYKRAMKERDFKEMTLLRKSAKRRGIKLFKKKK